MYENPLTKIFGEITEELNRQDEENCMVSIRQAVGYQVDKEELIKALNYDRNQYEKGYKDGYDAGYKRALLDLMEKMNE